MPAATNMPATTRLHVDELILDYLLWFCIESLLAERKLRQEGKVGKMEWTDASKSADMGLKLVNCLWSSRLFFYDHSRDFFQLTKSLKHSIKLFFALTQIPHFPIVSTCACGYAASRLSSYDALTSHRPPSHPAHPAMQRAQKPGSPAVTSRTFSPAPAAIPQLAKPNSVCLRLPSLRTTSNRTRKRCYAKWATIPFLHQNVHSGVTRR